MAAGRGHSRALDGLRFFAFFVVFLHHAFGSHYLEPLPFVRYGFLGVHVFFVLSGFLIGRILLDLRSREDLGFSLRFGRFYLRRALRIFPVYYLSLVVLGLLRATGWLPPWHLRLGVDAAYLTNVFLFLRPGGLDEVHFWSLCIEEHFYFVAPMAVLLLRRRTLSIVLALLWASIAAARGVIFLEGSGQAFWLLSPMHFDTLGVGIAAAIAETEGAFLGIPLHRLRRFGLASTAAFSGVMISKWLDHPRDNLVEQIVTQWLLAVSTATLIVALWRAPKTAPLARFFSFPPFAYLGKISYGLYLFHLFVASWIQLVLGGQSIRAALLAFGATVLLAVTSWHLFEKPINDLKERFPYPIEPEAPERLSAPHAVAARSGSRS